MATDIIARGMAGNVANLVKDIIIESGVEGIVKVSFEKHPSLVGRWYLVTEDIWKTKTKKLIPATLMAQYDIEGNDITKTYVADIQFEDGKMKFYSFKEDLLEEIDLSKATTYTNANPTTAQVGGIEKGTTFDNVSIEDVLNDLLYPYVAYNFSSITLKPGAGGTFEYGTKKTITGVVATFTNGSRSISNIIIKNGDTVLATIKSPKSGTVMTLPSAINWDGKSTLTITATMTDGKNTVSKSSSYIPTKYNYYGISTSATALPSSMTQYTTESVNITTTNGSFVYIYSPTKKTKMQQYELGDWNDMDTFYVGEVAFEINTGETLTYHAYRSAKLLAATNKYRLI